MSMPVEISCHQSALEGISSQSTQTSNVCATRASCKRRTKALSSREYEMKTFDILSCLPDTDCHQRVRLVSIIVQIMPPMRGAQGGMCQSGDRLSGVGDCPN